MRDKKLEEGGPENDDLIGSVRGGPPDLSEQTGEKFRRLLVADPIRAARGTTRGLLQALLLERESERADR